MKVIILDLGWYKKQKDTIGIDMSKSISIGQIYL